MYLQHEILFPAWIIPLHLNCCGLHILKFKGYVCVVSLCKIKNKIFNEDYNGKQYEILV